MKKYQALLASERPHIIRPLPELHYPERLNITRSLLEGAVQKGFGFAHRILLPRAGNSPMRWSGARCTVALDALRRLGVKEGDAVLLRQEDSAELVFSILAVWAIGAIAVPTYTQLRASDLDYRANDCGARIGIVDAALLSEMEQLPGSCASLVHLVVVPCDPTGRFVSLDSLLDDGDRCIAYTDTSADDVALILYTSGSTGRPKATSHSHADLLATPDTYGDYCLGMGTHDVVAGPPAIPFALGLDFFVLYTLRSGASAVLDSDKSPQALIDAMIMFGVTIIVGVSTYYNRLGQMIGERAITLPKLRIALCGGEPLPIEVERAWARATGKPLEQFLGTTELLNIFIGIRHGITPPKPGAMGRPIPGYEVSVRDADTFEPVGPGAPGLLCVRGSDRHTLSQQPGGAVRHRS